MRGQACDHLPSCYFIYQLAILVCCCDQTALITSFFSMLSDHETSCTWGKKKKLYSWRLHTGLLKYFSFLVKGGFHWNFQWFHFLCQLFLCLTISATSCHEFVHRTACNTVIFMSICRLVKKTLTAINNFYLPRKANL